MLGWALEKVRIAGFSHDVLRILWLQGMVQGNRGRLSEALCGTCRRGCGLRN